MGYIMKEGSITCKSTRVHVEDVRYIDVSCCNLRDRMSGRILPATITPLIHFFNQLQIHKPSRHLPFLGLIGRIHFVNQL